MRILILGLCDNAKGLRKHNRSFRELGFICGLLDI
jgi:hypothetical protein